MTQEAWPCAALQAANRSYHSCLRAMWALRMEFPPAQLAPLWAYITQQGQQPSTGPGQTQDQASRSDKKPYKQHRAQQQQQKQQHQQQQQHWLVELYDNRTKAITEDASTPGKSTLSW